MLVVSSAHQSATCSFGTNLSVFKMDLEVTKCILVVNQLSFGVSPYIHEKPHTKIHSIDEGFVIIVE